MKSHVVSIELQGEWQGQGVVVADYVLTAAHCLPVPESEYLLADETYVRMRRPDGKIGTMQAVFIDAVGDVAALATIDNDPFFLDGIEPMHVSFEWSDSIVFENRPRLPGQYLAHDAGVVDVQWCEINMGMATLWPSRPINGGTSGGPIINAEGLLIGIIRDSHRSSGHEEVSTFRLLGAALPPWLIASIKAAQASL
jgi:hypothetical protein